MRERIEHAAREVADANEHVKTVVLFGSRARGDAHPMSDWNIAVVHRDTAPALQDMLGIEALVAIPGASVIQIEERTTTRAARSTRGIEPQIVRDAVVLAGEWSIERAPDHGRRSDWEWIGALLEDSWTIRNVALKDQAAGGERDPESGALVSLMFLCRAIVTSYGVLAAGSKDPSACINQYRTEVVGRKLDAGRLRDEHATIAVWSAAAYNSGTFMGKMQALHICETTWLDERVRHAGKHARETIAGYADKAGREIGTMLRGTGDKGLDEARRETYEEHGPKYAGIAEQARNLLEN